MPRAERPALIMILAVAAALAAAACALAADPAPSAARLQRNNGYPIILVHGFMGFGRDEMLGYKYWGGTTDLQELLRGAGCDTHTAAVGPVSSNWDRACELYAQIKGGRVDYGLAHSRRFGHARYGRTYAGMAVGWGSSGGPAKVHLVGHSMGGQTIRLLAQLLAGGDQAERDAAGPGELSPLFAGGHDMVCSITTLSTPHDGTTLASGVHMLLPAAQQMITALAAAASPASGVLYDFKLDQWGLARRGGESFGDYTDRVWQSGLWTDTHDISAWDLCPEGARELNARVQTQPGVYYFSWSNRDTGDPGLGGCCWPNRSMCPIWLAGALFMGCHTSDAPGKVPIGPAWLPNDGVVNTISMDGPKLGSHDRIQPMGPAPAPGVWQHMGTIDGCDHSDIVGMLRYPGDMPDLERFYLDMAALLGSLPR